MRTLSLKQSLRRSHGRRSFLIGSLIACGLRPAHSRAAEVLRIEEEWRDAARSRNVPVRLYVPAIAMTPGHAQASIPWIIFSHGLGGSRAGGRAWGEALAAAGYLCVHVQHAGSDIEVWRNRLPQDVPRALQEAATGDQLLARIGDVRFVLDEVARRAKARATSGTQPALPWASVNVSMVLLSGHSFGASTTQAMLGQRFGTTSDYLAAEPRFVGAIAYSPNAREPRPADAFAAISRPFLSITGTQDEDPEILQRPGRARMPTSARQIPFEQMPAGDKYLMVFDGGDHMMFNGEPDLSLRRRTPDTQRLETRVHGATQEVIVLFANAYLRQDSAALAKLKSSAPVKLAAQDRWVVK